MWEPHLTVATVIELDGKFLMVEEFQDGELEINQPAGHVEENETFAEAAIRETLEETQWRIKLTHSLGISQFIAPNKKTYFRHSFCAITLNFEANSPRDTDITETIWLSYDEIERCKDKHRSPLVLRDIKNYKAGKLLDIDSIYHSTKP